MPALGLAAVLGSGSAVGSKVPLVIKCIWSQSANNCSVSASRAIGSRPAAALICEISELDRNREYFASKDATHSMIIELTSRQRTGGAANITTQRVPIA
jgi:hypothetical protein